jgi:hypothetical protein
MANKTIPELNEELWPQSTDFLLVHGSGLTKKVKLHNIQPDFYSSETIYLNYDPSTRHFIAHLKEDSVQSYHIFPLSAANIVGSDKNIEEWLLEIYSNTQHLSSVSALQDTTFQFLLSNSPSWNTAFNIATAYSSISSTFAGATPQTLFFTESSAELSIANANTVSLSAFNVFSNTIKPLTANWQNTHTVVRTNSANWQNTYANVFNNSANWQGTYTTVRTNSAKWEIAHTNATAYSLASSTFLTSETDSQTLVFNETTKDLSISNGNTISLSAFGTGADLAVRALTGNWQDTYTTVRDFSANWEAAYSTAGADLAVRALTGNWESTYTTVQNNSAQWASNVDTGVRALTSNWESTYTTVRDFSANWEESLEILPTVTNYLSTNNVAVSGLHVIENNLTVGSVGSTTFYIEYGKVGIKTETPNKELTVVGDISATGQLFGDGSQLTGIVAGDTEATTLVRTNSGQWNQSYDISTAYSLASSTFLTSETDSQTLTFNETTKDLSISNGNVVSLSALTDLTSVDTGVRTLTSNWQDTYTTVQNNSSRWESVYTNISTTSATFVKTTATTVPGTSAVTTIVAVSALPVTQQPGTLYILI